VQRETGTPTVVGGAEIRRWAYACVRTLETHGAEIDSINVFPVADSDTGTNLLHTMRAAFDALLRLPEDAGAGEMLAELARGALTGARGNSGVILSQVLRGFADAFAARPADPLRGAFCRCADLATAAVNEPAQGTMLTVLDVAAHTAADAPDCPPAELAETVLADAKKALAGTREQLDVLAEAGVVDAGALGLVLLLDQLAAVLAGRESGDFAPAEYVAPVRVARGADAFSTQRESGSAEFGYEVMYLLDGPADGAIDGLRGDLAGVGDSVSVAGDGQGRWTVHVHCNDIGAAIEAGIDVGRPHRITVARFADAAEPSGDGRFRSERAVVALTRGAGAAELFRGEGAAVYAVPSAAPPDPADLLAVIAGTRSAQVSVLCNEPAMVQLAETAATQARAAGQSVVVVPTASQAQGLAALAVHDPTRRAEDDVVAMAEAAAATLRGALVLAEDEALTWVGPCSPGDVLGLLADEIVLVRHGPPEEAVLLDAACQLIDRMLASGGELVTVLLGDGAPHGMPGVLEAHLRALHPEVDLAAYPGGQPDAVLLVGVE
jgi:DAK2 domain fusion protein YloV